MAGDSVWELYPAGASDPAEVREKDADYARCWGGTLARSRSRVKYHEKGDGRSNGSQMDRSGNLLAGLNTPI